jgi:hypothetical protein
MATPDLKKLVDAPKPWACRRSLTDHGTMFGVIGSSTPHRLPG